MTTRKKRSDWITLERILLGTNLVTGTQLSQAQQVAMESSVNMGTALMYLGFVDPIKLGKLLETKQGIPTVANPTIALSVRKLIEPKSAIELQVAPLNIIEESGNRVLMLGMTDPLDAAAIADAESLAHVKVQPTFLSLHQLQELYKKYYHMGLDLYPPEVTSNSNLRTMNRGRILSSSTLVEGVVSSASDTLRLEALVSLLVEKGIISQEEYTHKLRKLTT